MPEDITRNILRTRITNFRTMDIRLYVLLILAMANAVWSVSTPSISSLKPHGIRFAYPDSPGISLVAFHYSINKPVVNVAAGDKNYDVVAKTGNEWVLEDRDVDLQPGDKVYYWTTVIQNGQGHLLTDQVWVVPEPTTKPPKPTTTSTTIRSTTKAGTQRPIVNTPDPQLNHFQTNGPATTPVDSNILSYYSQQPVPSGGQNAGTQSGSGTAVSGTSGTASSGSCACVGNSIRPPGSERSCAQFPCLVFDDEFDRLDLDVWEHEITASGGGNWEFQYYTNNRSNSYVKDGKLFIKPTLTIDSLNEGPDGLTKGALDIWGSQPGDLCTGNIFWGCRRDGTPDHIINPIQSARLRSSRGFNFKYGKVEVRAKMPKGDWLWPAIWMLPLRNAYGKWPASGEIDIVESRGNSEQYRDNSGKPQGRNVVSSTLHFGSDFWHNKWPTAHGEKVLSSGSFADGFHNYTLIWDDNSIRSYIDGDKILDVAPQTSMWEYGGNNKEGVENPWEGRPKMAPFDQEFFLILNVAVGGTGFFPDTNTYTIGKPWNDKSDFAPRDFWNARGQWYPTWNPKTNNGEDAAMQVDYIKVWKMKP